MLSFSKTKKDYFNEILLILFYLRRSLPRYIEDGYFDYLLNLNMHDIKIYAVPGSTFVFPRIPLMQIEGPVFKTRLLETTLLALVNYASLVATTMLHDFVQQPDRIRLYSNSVYAVLKVPMVV